MRFHLVDAAKKDFPVACLCKVLDVSPSGYFAWKNRPASTRQREDLVLLAHVRSAFTLSHETYGSPRMTHELRGDSPVGQAAWIYEKFWEWTDNDDTPESVLTRDELLDNITLYWLTNTGASSARLYWESLQRIDVGNRIDLPTAFSVFPQENVRASRRWAETKYTQIVHFNDAIERGGHFAAFERPEIFIEEVRTSFRMVNATSSLGRVKSIAD